MKVRIRRVGNSLGVLLPKALLAAWGVGEGDELAAHRAECERGIRPASKAFSHRELDDLRLSLSSAVIRKHTAA